MSIRSDSTYIDDSASMTRSPKRFKASTSEEPTGDIDHIMPKSKKPFCVSSVDKFPPRGSLILFPSIDLIRLHRKVCKQAKTFPKLKSDTVMLVGHFQTKDGVMVVFHRCYQFDKSSYTDNILRQRTAQMWIDLKMNDSKPGKQDTLGAYSDGESRFPSKSDSTQIDQVMDQSVHGDSSGDDTDDGGTYSAFIESEWVEMKRGDTIYELEPKFAVSNRFLRGFNSRVERILRGNHSRSSQDTVDAAGPITRNSPDADGEYEEDNKVSWSPLTAEALELINLADEAMRKNTPDIFNILEDEAMKSSNWMESATLRNRISSKAKAIEQWQQEIGSPESECGGTPKNFWSPSPDPPEREDA